MSRDNEKSAAPSDASVNGVATQADMPHPVVPVVEEEVFEMQSLHPYKLRWRESSRPWCDRCGGDPSSPYFILPLPFDPTSTSKDDDCGVKRGWTWQSRWTIDRLYTPCDEEGWTYGMSITAMNKHLADGTYRVKPRPYDILRRRRWVRRRARSQAAAADGAVDEGDKTRFYRVLRLDSALSHIMHGRATPLQQMHNLKFHPDDIVMEGWLGKYGSFTHNWKLRYFLLRRDTNTLVYLQDTSSLLQLGQVPITTHTAVEVLPPASSTSHHQFAFELVNGARRWRLNAPTEAIKMQWVNAIHDIMFQRQPPYSLQCAPMHRTRPDYQTSCVLPQLVALEAVWESAVSFIRSTFDDLLSHSTPANTAAADHSVLLSKNLPSPAAPSSELVAFRHQVEATLDSLHQQYIAPLTSTTNLTLLSINQAKDDAYNGCLALVESILSFQPPSSKTVLKRRSGDATRRQSIPNAWLAADTPSSSSFILPATTTTGSTSDRGARRLDETTPPPLVLSTKTIPAKASLTKIPPPTSPVSPSNKPHRHPPCGRKHVRAQLRRAFEHRAEHLERGIGGLVVWANERDIGSLIAYTLVSPKYVDQLQECCKAISVLHELQGKMTLRTPPTYREIKNPATHHFKCHFVLDTYSTSTSSSHPPTTTKDGDATSRHSDGSSAPGGTTDDDAVTSVTVYFAPQFHCLRQVTEPGNTGFLNAIAKSAPWETSGGKSGAFFSLSHDQQFVLKGVAATEFNMFVEFAPAYFEYMATVAESKADSCLAKILGAYKIQLHGHAKPMFVFVMECSIFGFDLTQLYDLKGVRRNRTVDRPVVYKKVLPDENFVDRVPVHVRPQDLTRFLDALSTDVTMLSANGVIDYSLLLAFDDASLSIRGALIDYVHQFDFIKRVESGAKKMYQSPTVLPPIPYKVRFLEAMNCNFNSRHDQPRVDTPNELGPTTPGKVQRSQSDIITTTTSSHAQETLTNGIRPRSVSDAGSHAGPRTVSLVSIVE